MKLKFIQDEDFVNYKKPSMFLGTTKCDFKCCTEANIPISICQNEPWSKEPIRDIPDSAIAERYLKNPFTSAIVVGGLEPMLQFDELYNLISTFRNDYHCDDTFIIYTGYYYEEIAEKIEKLKTFKNIIVKYGRFVDKNQGRFDEILGVHLISDNQYAEIIS